MSDILKTMERELLELLCTDYQKTAEHLTEELKVEHPAMYQQLIRYFAGRYGLGGCGAQMSPQTAVKQTLAKLQQEGLVACSQANGTVLWHKL